MYIELYLYEQFFHGLLHNIMFAGLNIMFGWFLTSFLGAWDDGNPFVFCDV